MDIGKLLSKLDYRGFKPFFVADKAEAVELILSLIPKTDSIGFGGSTTVTELNLHNELSKRGNTVYHRDLAPLIPADRILKSAIFADWFIASANAITEDGELVNTDGRSNRVASLIYGSKNSLVVLGVNKIVKNIPDALKRIREIAAPLNCKRLNIDNPCVYGGSCKDCDPETTICKTTTVQHYPPSGREYYVIIINEALGF